MKRKRDEFGCYAKKDPQYTPLLEYEEIEDWIDDQPSITTQRIYLSRLYTFLEFTSLTPKKFLGLNDKKRKRIVKKYLNERKREGKQGIVANTFAVINSFLAYHDKKIEWEKGDRRKYAHSSGVWKGRRIALKKEEVYALADATTTLRDRALILCMWQSGVRPNCLSRWDWKLVKNHVDKEEQSYIPLRLSHGYDTKTSSYGNGFFYTFLNEESVKALKVYLDYRRKEQGWEPKDNDPLFVTEGKGGKRKGKQLNRQTFHDILNNAARANGIDPLTISPRSLRKSYATNLASAGVQPFFISFFLGHSPKVNDEYYINFQDVDNLYKQYSKANWSRAGGSRLNHVEEELRQVKTAKAVFEDRVSELEEEVKTLRTILVGIVQEADKKRKAAKELGFAFREEKET